MKVQERRITTRPLKVSSFFAALPCVAILVLVGCGGGQDSAQGESEETSTTGSTVAESTGGGAETTAGTGTTAGAGTTAETTAGASTTAETTGGASTTAETTGGASTTAETTSSGATEPTRPYTAVVPASGLEPGGVPVGDALAAGAEDPSTGPLQTNRLVTFYGNPRSAQMGILGEYADPETMMEQLKQQTLAYSAIDPERPAVPTIELIASTAQRDPGPDGNYLGRLSTEEIEQYAQLAEENGALLLLDIQIGQSTIPDEIEYLRPFLERPYVHLAIDTEYSVEPGQVPGVDLGSVDGSEIQDAIESLTRMVDEQNIPDKVVVVHQFTTAAITNKQLISPTRNVEVVLNADGFGSPENKISKYNALVSGEPIQYGGFKLFYSQDPVLLSPEQVLQLDPVPAVVNYQ